MIYVLIILSATFAGIFLCCYGIYQRKICRRIEEKASRGEELTPEETVESWYCYSEWKRNVVCGIGIFLSAVFILYRIIKG